MYNSKNRWILPFKKFSKLRKKSTLLMKVNNALVNIVADFVKKCCKEMKNVVFETGF